YDGTAMVFTAMVPVTAVKFERMEWRVPKDMIRAMSVGAGDYPRMIARGAGGAMLGGNIGGLVGMATGKRNSTLLVAYERDDFPITGAFAITAADGRWLIDAIQKSRKGRGEDAFPTLEEFAKA